MVRAERPTDIEGIRQVLTAAFAQPDEARLVDDLRQSGDLHASSVAIIENEIVGHAALSKGWIDDAAVLVLAPVAVDPRFQRQGIGTVMVNHVLTSTTGPVVVLGDPDYYSRFGFAAADDHRIDDPTFNPPPGFLQVLHTEVAPTGALTYPDPFLRL
jgi:putative acetyltransferase